MQVEHVRLARLNVIHTHAAMPIQPAVPSNLSHMSTYVQCFVHYAGTWCLKINTLLSLYINYFNYSGVISDVHCTCCYLAPSNLGPTKAPHRPYPHRLLKKYIECASQSCLTGTFLILLDIFVGLKRSQSNMIDWHTFLLLHFTVSPHILLLEKRS